MELWWGVSGLKPDRQLRGLPGREDKYLVFLPHMLHSRHEGGTLLAYLPLWLLRASQCRRKGPTPQDPCATHATPFPLLVAWNPSLLPSTRLT